MLLSKALQFAASQEQLVSYLLSRNLQLDNVHRSTIKAVYEGDVFTGAEIYFDYGTRGRYCNDVYVHVAYNESTGKFTLEALMVDIGTGSQSIWQKKK